MYQILSKSANFYRRHNKHCGLLFFLDMVHTQLPALDLEVRLAPHPNVAKL